MALDEGNVIDEETGTPTTTTTTATPGGSAPGPRPTAPGGPSPRPTATPGSTSTGPTRTTTFVSPLEQVMSAHNEAWLGRMRNIGAGGSSMTGVTKNIPGGPLGDYKLRAIGTGVMSVLSGGFLGSYSLSAKGSIQKALDAITEQRTEIDYNSTARVSNIWRSTDKQIHSLSTKIRLCEEIEQSIDDQITINEGLTDAATALKNASAGETKAAAAEVSSMWKKIKPYRSQIGVGAGSFATVAMLGCPPLAAAALCGMLPVGIAMTIRKAKNAPTYDPDNTKKLRQARALVNTIRKDAEHKRDELLKKLEKKYPQEVKVQKDTRAYFTTEVPKVVSKKDATTLLDEYESLVMRPPINSDRAIQTLIDTMSAMKKADNASANAFSKVNLGQIKTSLVKLLSKKSLEYRQKINESLGLMEATGPEQMTSLIRRICQMHGALPQTGRLLQLTIGATGEKKMYRIQAVAPDKLDINLQEVNVGNHPLTGEVVVTTVPGNPVSIHPDKKTMELQRELYKVSTADLVAEMASKTENDLLCSDPHPNPPITAEVTKKHKELLAKAKKERLTVSQYKELWAALKPAPADYEKCGLPLIYKIANQTSDTFETKKENKHSTEDLIAELNTKTEHDLITGGTTTEISRRKELLAKSKKERLTVAEYKELWASLKPPSPHYAQNGLPLISQIANNPNNTFEQKSDYKQSTAGLINEIKTKSEHDLIGGTPTEIARQKQLLAAAKTKRLTVAEYKELWEALRPPSDYIKNNLPSIYEIAHSPLGTFEKVSVFIQPTEGLINEIKIKSDYDLIEGTPSETAQRKQLLARAKRERLSVAEYKELWASLKSPPHIARNGLVLLEEIANNPSDTFEEIMVDKIPSEDLIAEIRTKTESDLVGGTSSETAQRKQLLARAKRERLSVAEYKELWASLKSPPHIARNGLVLLEEIANNPSDTFEEIMVDKIPSEDLIAEISYKTNQDLIGGTPSEAARQRKLLADAKTRKLDVAEYKELWAALKKPTEGRIGLTLLEEIANQSSLTFEQKDVDAEPAKKLMAEIASKTYSDLIGGTPAEVAAQKKLLDDAKVKKLTVPEYKELWKVLKKPTPGQAGLKKIEAIAKGGADPEYSHPKIEDTDMLELL